MIYAFIGGFMFGGFVWGILGFIYGMVHERERFEIYRMLDGAHSD